MPQLPYFRRVLGALRLPLLEMPGYEADDIIATLCRIMKDRGCEIVVVSSDKDLLQLVTDGVTHEPAGQAGTNVPVEKNFFFPVVQLVSD